MKFALGVLIDYSNTYVSGTLFITECILGFATSAVSSLRTSNVQGLSPFGLAILWMTSQPTGNVAQLT